MTRILDEMEEMKRSLDAVMLDHMSGEYPTDTGSARLYWHPTHSAFKIHASTVELYAERNGELHVLCRTLLDKYRALAPDDPWVHEADAILCNVPQCRMEPDAPLRRGY